MRKTLKKSLIFFICLMMLCVSSAFPLYANAQVSVGGMRENSALAAGGATSLSDTLLSTGDSITKKFNSKTYYSSGIQLYKTIRDNLVKRNNNFTVCYLSPSKYRTKNQMLSLIEELYFLASDDEISESCVDGDYIRWAVSNYGYSSLSLDNTKDGYYYYTINLEFLYYDTAQQEKEVDKVVKSFVSGINTNTMTDYEIIKAIHDFILDKSTYDEAAVLNFKGSEYALTAYGTLIKGKSVCQGYASSFYRLCKELGYNARFVSSSEYEGCHAWNIVQLDGKYYYVDTTWDDTALEHKSEDLKYSYFLVNYQTIQKDDNNKQHKLNERFYNSDYYRENYRSLTDANDYNSSDKSLFSQSIISLPQTSYEYTGSGITPEVSILSYGFPEEYTLKYSNNKNAGTARVDICSKDGLVSLSHRNFKIVSNGSTETKPAAPSSPKITSLTPKSKSIKVKFKSVKCSGYQIQYSTKKDMSSAKTINAKGSSVIKTIPNLKKGKKYYIRIRAYKTYTSSGKTNKSYSKYSAKKSIVCK